MGAQVLALRTGAHGALEAVKRHLDRCALSPHNRARRRDPTCANRPATNANMSSNPARHRSNRSSAIVNDAATALSFRPITPEVDHEAAVSMATTRQPRSHTAAAVLGGAGSGSAGSRSSGSGRRGIRGACVVHRESCSH